MKSVLYIADDLNADNDFIKTLKLIPNIELDTMEFYDLKNNELKYYNYIIADYGGFHMLGFGNNFTMFKRALYFIKELLIKKCDVLYVISAIKLLPKEEITDLIAAGVIFVDITKVKLKNLLS